MLAAASLESPLAFGLAPLVTLLGLTTAVFGGSPAASTALDLAMGGTVAPGLHGGIIVADRPTQAEEQQGFRPTTRREVLRGGLTIGVLERIASAGAIVAGFPEGTRDRRRRQGRRPVHRARGARGARTVHHRHVREPDLGLRGARLVRRISLMPLSARRRSVVRARVAAVRRDAGSPGIQKRHGNAAPPPAPLTPVRGPVANGSGPLGHLERERRGEQVGAARCERHAERDREPRRPAREVAIGCAGPPLPRELDARRRPCRRAAAPPAECPACPATMFRQTCMP